MVKERSDLRTYRDLIKNRYPSYLKLQGWTAILTNFFSPAVRLPLVRRLFMRSFTMNCFALSNLREKSDYVGLYRLLIEILLSTHFRKNNIFRWWYLMRYGIAVAQERQITWLIRDLILEDNLILIGSLGPKPWQGYDVAYAFVGYSLWLFERGDVQGAIKMVQIAVQADLTWGYPEYLHGWYGLFTKGVDSVTHFAKAVQMDWSFLQRMKQDKTCRQHPEMLREVQKRILVVK